MISGAFKILKIYGELCSLVFYTKFVILRVTRLQINSSDYKSEFFNVTRNPMTSYAEAFSTPQKKFVTHKEKI